MPRSSRNTEHCSSQQGGNSNETDFVVEELVDLDRLLLQNEINVIERHFGKLIATLLSRSGQDRS